MTPSDAPRVSTTPPVTAIKIFFSLLLLTVYLAALTELLPEGINQHFALNLFRVTVLICVCFGLAQLSPRWRTRGWHETTSDRERFVWADVWLLCMPMTPVCQYLLLNQTVLSWHDNVGIISASVIGLMFWVLLIPWLMSAWMARWVTLLSALGLSFVLLNMAAMARSLAWHENGNFIVQIALLAVFCATCLYLYRKDRGALYLMAGCYLVGSVVMTHFNSATLSPGDDEMQVATFHQQSSDQQSSIWQQAFPPEEIQHTPDIFLLTYDAYVGNETMLQYGIDNASQEQFLDAQGFDLYPETYSVASTSRESMSRVLGAATAHDGAAGFGPVVTALENAGYQSHGVFMNGYFFNGVGIGYDVGFPPPSPPSLVLGQAILEGEFRHDVSFVDTPHEVFVAQKRAVMRNSVVQPKFLYTHTGPGHTQNSGKCLSDDTERFRQRLVTANEEMRDDVATIVQHQPGAIIIINGDHGPYLTKNCTSLLPSEYSIADITPLDIQDRFGTFLAIRWPESYTVAPYSDVMVLQDVFPKVFSVLFAEPVNQDLRLPPRLTHNLNRTIAGVQVESGLIVGGTYDGTPLFGVQRLVTR